MKGVEPTFNITVAVTGREEEVGIAVDSVELIVVVTSTVVALAVDAFTDVASTDVASTDVASTVVASTVVASAVVASAIVVLAVVCPTVVAFAVVTSINVVASGVVPSAVVGSPFVGVVICSVEVESDEVGAAVDNMEEAVAVDVNVTTVEDDSVVVETEVVTSLSHSCIFAPSSASWKQYSTKFFK